MADTPSLYDELTSSAKQMGGALSGAVVGAEQQLGQAYKSTTDYLKETGKSISDYYTPVAKNLTKNIATAAKPLTDYYATTGKNIVSSTKQAMSTAEAAGAAARPRLAALSGILETRDSPNGIISDVQRSKEQNRALKNPLEAVGLEGRGQAIGGKLERLYADPDYQKLSAEGKIRVRNEVYDRYVVPTFQEAGRKPPGREEWLMNTRTDIADIKKSGVLPETISSTTAGALGVTIAGAKYVRRTWAQVSGLSNFFHGDTAGDLEGSWNKGMEQANRSLAGRAVGSLEAGLDEVNFFTNSRPRDTLLSSAAVWGGEQVAQLPVYGAVGEGLEALKVAEGAMGALGKVAPDLTKTLEASKTGRFVGRRLMNAADGYLSSRAIGETHEEGVKGAVGFAIFGALAEPAGKALKMGWEAATKKFTSNVIAMGGKQLQAELTDFVIAEAKGQHVVNAEDAINRKMHDAEHDVLDTISQKETGKPFTEAVKNKEDLDKVVAERGRIAEHAAVEAPIHNPDLVQQETQQSIEAWNKQHEHSDAITKQLQALGRDVVKDNVVEKVHTAEVQSGLVNPEKAAEKVAKAGAKAAKAEAAAAAKEAEKVKIREKLKEVSAIALPKDLAKSSPRYRDKQLKFEDPRDLALYTVAHDYGAPEKKSAAHDKFLDYLEKHFPGESRTSLQTMRGRDVRARVKELASKAGEDEEVVTIPKSEFATQEAPKAAEHEEEYEPKEGEVARLTPEMLGVCIKDTRAFYKNPTSKLDKAGRIIGARDQRTIGERIRDTHTERFMNLLEDIDGGKIKFEKPKDRLIWHWGFREHMSPQMKRALRLQLSHAYKDAETQVAEDSKSLDRRHQRIMTHLKMLLETGKLRTEKNVFRSTKTSGRGTPWQLQLRAEHKELTDKQIAANVRKHKGGYQALNAVKSLLRGTA